MLLNQLDDEAIAASQHEIVSGGKLGKLIREFNWSNTPLGSIDLWDKSLKTTINIILHSPMPFALLWGKEGIMLYNDAYSELAGKRHPYLLGCPVFEGWPEAKEFNENVLHEVLKFGKSLTYKDQKFTLYRNSITEEVWMDLNYSPVFNDKGNPGGVLAAVFETTERVVAEIKRSQAEEQLKEEQHRLHTLFMNAPAAIAIISGPDLRFQLANDSYKRLSGKNMDLIGHKITDVFPDLSSDLLDVIKNSAFNGERFTANEFPVELDWDNNGKPYIKYLNFVYEPIFDKGLPNGFICFGFDVTGLVEARFMTEKSESKLRAIIEATPECIKIISADGTLQFMNSTGLDMIQASHEIVGSACVFDVIAPEFKEEWKLNHKRVCSGESLSWEFDIIDLKGKRHRMETYAVPLPGAAGYSHLGVTRDITTQYEMQEALRKSENSLRVMAESMPQKVFTINANGDTEYINPQWVEYTGMTVEELKNWTSFIHPEDLEGNLNSWAFAVEHCTTFQFEHRFRRFDGEYRWHLTRAVPMTNEKGELISWIGSSTEIHDQKTALEQKDEFISVASHELKTPLTCIKAYMQLLKRTIPQPEQKKYIEKTNNYVNKLQRLISDLLDVSKIQAGKLQFDFQQFCFDKMVDEAIESISHITDSHQITKRSSIDHIMVYGDKIRLEQVMINLLSNAIKYSPNNDKVFVDMEIKSGQLIVSVTDFGIGIPEDKHQKVFQRFYRAETSAYQFTGLGIGLYISSEIVTRHNGKVWMDSEVGKGSTFYFSIPLTS